MENHRHTAHTHIHAERDGESLSHTERLRVTNTYHTDGESQIHKTHTQRQRDGKSQTTERDREMDSLSHTQKQSHRHMTHRDREMESLPHTYTHTHGERKGDMPCEWTMYVIHLTYRTPVLDILYQLEC
ncbi:hypothetical protein ACRRTK_006859 [Alexandromys fortis]